MTEHRSKIRPRGGSRLAVVIAVLALGVGAGAQACGDCDRSGSIAILDSLRAAQIAVALITPASIELELCDVDADQDIDVLDALALAQSSAGIPVLLVCPPPRVPVATSVTIVTPASGDVQITYTLSDPDSDPVDVTIMVSSDGGLSFTIPATPGIGGDGLTGLASSPAGIPHLFVWDSLTDLGPVAELGVMVAIHPSDGRPGTTGFSQVALVDNRPPGIISFALDLEPIIHDLTPSGRGCLFCHIAPFPPADLDLSSYATLMLGSAGGPVVIPLDPGSSLIVCKLEGGMACGNQMPLGGQPWSAAQTQMMRDWIMQGALDN